jgi:ribonuclease Z
MSITVHILGANSAVPNKNRFPTSQYIKLEKESILIDCGEGAQINLSKYKLKPSRIKTILISHLHGDHVYGLPGLIGSFNLAGRQEPLTVVGPVGIQAYLSGVFETTYVTLNFELLFHELGHNGLLKVIELNEVIIEAFPMKHRIPTYGYKITEKERQLNIKSEVIKKYDLSITQIKAIKAGDDIVSSEGNVIPNKDLTKEQPKMMSYAYCSDTVYDEDLIPLIHGVDLLYHEATYLHELQKIALKRKHATAKEAGVIAQKANVGRLIIGHYSSRYDDLQPLENEAKIEFENAHIVRDGDVYTL